MAHQRARLASNVATSYALDAASITTGDNEMSERDLAVIHELQNQVRGLQEELATLSTTRTPPEYKYASPIEAYEQLPTSFTWSRSAFYAGYNAARELKEK
jgi:hypothetical protein